MANRAPSSAPEAPTEKITLTAALEDLTRRGFTEQFTLVGGSLRGVQSGKSFAADQVEIAEYHRFEGVSDPDDMAILYALDTSSGLRGTLVDAFGVYSDPQVGAFMKEVQLRRQGVS